MSPTTVHLVKAMVSPAVTYGCESWTIKKAERQRIDASELWCWRRLLDYKIKPVNPKGNQSWIFFGRTDAKAETPILWPPDTKNWVIWKDPDDGKHWRQEEKEMTEDDNGWMASLTQRTWVWVNSGSWWWAGKWKPGVLQSIGSQRIRHDWAIELIKLHEQSYTWGIKIKITTRERRREGKEIKALFKHSIFNTWNYIPLETRNIWKFDQNTVHAAAQKSKKLWRILKNLNSKFHHLDPS